MKHAKKKWKPKPTGKKAVRRKTPRGSARRNKSVQANRRVTKVLARMRKEGTSLRSAAREAKVSPKTVLKAASSALKKTANRRYSAKPSDRLVRTLMIPTPTGPEEIDLRGLNQASLLGAYWSSLHKYYETGRVSELQKFEGKSATAVGGLKYPLITDTEILDRLGSAGVVSFESLYARS